MREKIFRLCFPERWPGLNFLLFYFFLTNYVIILRVAATYSLHFFNEIQEGKNETRMGEEDALRPFIILFAVPLVQRGTSARMNLDATGTRNVL